MDAQNMVMAAAATHQASIGLPDATQGYNKLRKASAKLRVALTPAHAAIFRKCIDFPYVDEPEFHVTNDHPALVALRQMTRDAYSETYKIRQLRTSTLVVGAASRELFLYHGKKNFDFHFHMSETKDVSRVIIPIFENFLETLEERAIGRLEPTVADMPRVGKRPQKLMYREFKTLLNDYVALNSMPNRVVFETQPSYTTLLLEDSAYNLDGADWIRLFDTTHASVAYGYMLLPLELLFSDTIENPMYSIVRDGDYCELVYKLGSSTGYRHRHSAWTLLLKTLGLHSPRFNIVFELNRIGPMVFFSATKTATGGTLVREIGIPKSQHYVLVLDLRKSYDVVAGCFKSLHYMSVAADEWDRSVNYLLTLQKDLASKTSSAAYARRRIDGAALVSRELVEAWTLDQSRLASFRLSVFLHAQWVLREEQLIEDRTVRGIGTFSDFFRAMCFSTLSAVPGLARLLERSALSTSPEIFVKRPDMFLHQRQTLDETTPFEGVLRGQIDPSDPAGGCPICRKLRLGKFDMDAIRCQHKESSVEFAMTTAELTAFKTQQCLSQVNDPPDLLRVKERAFAACPSEGFSYTCPVFYIRGPPGTGKSTIIRFLADYLHDSILAPFSKLAEDYLGVEHDGRIVSYKFATNHRAVGHKSILACFCDEISAIDVRFLYTHIALNRPSAVFLVGDTEQCRIQEPAEGWYFENRIDLSTVSTHTLRFFYRGPRDVAAFCNLYWGYDLCARKTQMRSYRVVTIAEGLALQNHQRIYFSDNTATNLGLGPDAASARAIQGSTVDNAVLFITAADAHPAGETRLVRVAMTRHRFSCPIASDDSPFARQWLAQFNFAMDDDQINALALRPAPVRAADPYAPCPELNRIISERADGAVVYEGLAPAPLRREDSQFSVPFFLKKLLRFSCVRLLPLVLSASPIGFYGDGNLFEFAERVWPAPEQVGCTEIDLIRRNASIIPKAVVALSLFGLSTYCLLSEKVSPAAQLNSLLESIPVQQTTIFESFDLPERLGFSFGSIPFGGETLSALTASQFGICAVGLVRPTFISQRRAYPFLTRVALSCNDHLRNVVPPILRLVKLPFAAIRGTLSFTFSLLTGIPMFSPVSLVTTVLPDDIDLQDYAGPAGPLSRGFCWLRLFPTSAWSELTSTYPSHLDSFRLFFRFFRDVLLGGHEPLGVDVFRGHIASVDYNVPPLVLAMKILASPLLVRGPDGAFSLGFVHRFFLAKKLLNRCGELFGLQFSTTQTWVLSGIFAAYGNVGILAGSNSGESFVLACAVLLGLIVLFSNRVLRAIRTSGIFVGASEDSYDSLPVEKLEVCAMERRLGFDASETAEYIDFVETYAPDPRELFVSVPERIECDLPRYVLERPSYDAFLIAPELLDTAYQSVTYAMNAGADHLVFGEFSNGKYQPDAFFSPVNARGNPKGSRDKYYEFFTAPGLHYSANNPWQTLQVIQWRYCNAGKPQPTPKVDEIDLVRTIVDKFFLECADESALSKINTFQMQSIFSEFAAAARSKHYGKQFTTFDDASGAIMRFHLKKIFKPAKSGVKIFKVGQGIGAWSKTAQILFSIVGRTLNKLFGLALRRNCVYDNGMTESQFFSRVSAILKDVPECAQNGLCDFFEYDSEQNSFSQNLEREFWARLGVSRDLLDLYYRFRRDYRILAPGVSARVAWAKPSGEPLTLVNNTVINALILNYVFRGSGPFCMVVKGDDGWKVQEGIHVNQQAYKQVMQHTRLRMLAAVEPVVEFCGQIVSRAGIYPCIIRRLAKACAAHYKDWTHFAEAQKSFRNFEKFLSSLDVPAVYAANAEKYGVDVDLIASAMYALQSLSHISEAQFLEHFRYVEVDYGVPAATHRGRAVGVAANLY